MGRIMIKKILIPKNILILSLLLNILIHLPFINMGPRSVHVWRQSNTLAVARNFYKEDMNILKPRVDRRLDTDGVTGMQFPSYEFLLAALYKIFGEHNFLHRLLSLIISSWGMIGMFYLSQFLIKDHLAAAFSAVAYAFSPDLFYFGFSALPDILALACSVWGLYYFLNWFFENPSYKYFLLSLLLLILAGLTKIQFLAVGFFIAPLIFMYADVSRKKIPLLVIFGLLASLIPVSWYLYSVHLIESSGLRDFGITFRPMNDFNIALQTIIKNLISDLPDILLNYASFILFLLSIYFFFVQKFWKSKWFLPMLCYTIALLAYHIIELNQMTVHSYYMMPYLPVLFLMIAYAVRSVSKFKWSYSFLLVILLLEPVLASVRILPSRFLKSDPGIPMALYNDTSRSILVNAVPENALCIVGPDVSGCIYFYHLEKKGFGFDNSNDLFYPINDHKNVLKDYIDRGAQYLITNDSSFKSNQEFLENYADSLILMEKDFLVYKLH